MASDIYFSNNPADWQQLEGLYVSEKDPPGFIRGVNLNTVGVVGQTVRGPVNKAVVITSTARFLEVFGGRDYGSGGSLISHVWKDLLRKPFGKLVVVRVAASDAAAAERDFLATATPIINIAAANVGAWGNDITVDIVAATDGNVNHFNLKVNYLGATTEYENLDTTAGNDNLATVIGDDDGNLVVVTKLADGRPDNIAAASLTDTAGSDGTIAAAQYGSTGTGTGIDLLNNTDDVGICFVADTPPTIATVNAAVFALAAADNDRIWLIWNGTHAASVATVTADAANYQSDRIVYCYNSPFVVDPTTGTEVQVAPHSWMASILSQTDVDVHPGCIDAAQYTTGIKRLQSDSLTRADLISLRDAGVSTLEKSRGRFVFRSGVTTDLTPGKTEITRRRMTDFLQLSAAERLRYFVKRKNTIEVRAQISGELDSFSATLMHQGRIVDDYEIDTNSVNTSVLRAQGQESILWRVRLVGHILYLVFQTEIGTGVTIEVA